MSRMLAYEYAYLSPMGWPCIYSRCSTSWMLIKIRSHLMRYFLSLSVSDLVKDIERAVYLGKSSFLIGGSGLICLMSCYIVNYLISLLVRFGWIFKIIYYWGLFYFPYLWETSHNRPLGRADWTFILGWHQKA